MGETNIYITPTRCAGGGGLKSASRDHRRHPLGFDRCERAFGFCEGLCGVTTVDVRCRLFFRHLFDDFELFDFSDDRCTKSSFGKKRGSFFRFIRKNILGQVLRKSLLRVTTVDDLCRFVSRLFFDELGLFDFSEKGHWARCFGKHLGSSGGVREGIWGRPGGVREASWGVLGGSGGRLGRVLGALGAILERPWRQSDFGSFC